MPYLLPVRVGDVVYHDARAPDPPFDIYAAYNRYAEILDERIDRMREFLDGEEPGCEQMRERVAAELYTKYKVGGGRLRFRKWLDIEEAKRHCPDPRTDESFMWLGIGREKGEPRGGIGLYNIEVLESEGRLVRYVAMCAPMLDDPSEASRFMRHMLEGTQAGRNDEGVLVDTMLVRWHFPRGERRNRWDLRSPLATEYLSALQGFEIVMEKQGLSVFPVQVRRAAS